MTGATRMAGAHNSFTDCPPDQPHALPLTAPGRAGLPVFLGLMSTTRTDSDRRDERGARRHAAPRPRRRALNVLALSLLGVALFVTTAVGSVYVEIQSRIDSKDINALLGENRPGGADQHGDPTPDPRDSWAGKPLNVLVLGSDYRGGDNAQYGEFEGMRSDTALIVHFSADRERVDVVSIPRDLIVAIPACPLPGGGESYPQALGTNEHNGVRFNAAFATGGQGEDLSHAAACAILTVEAMTDIYIDDWAVIDMDGFATMVDAIGGVQMCFDEPMNVPKADLDLEAGCQTLDGDDALGLARARKGIGDGSDISRIDRQQELMTAMVGQVLSADTLANPSKLLSLLSSAASSLTTSERLGNLNSLTGLGYSLRGIDGGSVNFSTAPHAYSGNVVLQTPETDLVWDALRADEPLPGDPAGESTEESTEESTVEPTASSSPSS
ncbi:LytR family transcriptional regulator [Pseudactinotalea sp. HY158]|nr:LytR family transcriptional regulator [Pseudactinotalea sp. HY158]